MIRPGVDATLAVSVFDTPEDLGRDLAAAILAALALARRSFVLGCPSGRSLTSTYVALAAQAARERADLSQLVIAMMDEYVREEEGRFVPCPASAHVVTQIGAFPNQIERAILDFLRIAQIVIGHRSISSAQWQTVNVSIAGI